jgi:hypothetical protein
MAEIHGHRASARLSRYSTRTPPTDPGHADTRIPSSCSPHGAAHDGRAAELTMASAGIRKTPTGRYKVWWRLDVGTQGAKTFDTRNLARDFKNELLAQVAADSWTDPRRGRILFDEWANHWWQLWASSPRRSPKGMETTESHLRPHFGRRQLRQITPSIVLRWQHELEGKRSHSGVMACRSILLRILEAARRERLIPTHPVRDVEAPRPRINPERIFGRERRRTFTPTEFGHLLAACRPLLPRPLPRPGRHRAAQR